MLSHLIPFSCGCIAKFDHHTTKFLRSSFFGCQMYTAIHGHLFTLASSLIIVRIPPSLLIPMLIGLVVLRLVSLLMVILSFLGEIMFLGVLRSSLLLPSSFESEYGALHKVIWMDNLLGELRAVPHTKVPFSEVKIQLLTSGQNMLKLIVTSKRLSTQFVPCSAFIYTSRSTSITL